MNEFTLSLALLDFLPVVFFGASGVLLGIILTSPLMGFGAIIATAAGVFKACWKLIYTLKNRDIPWLNKVFFPLMSVGYLALIVGLILNYDEIGPSHMLSLPQIIFYLLWFAGMALTGWYRKKYFDKFSYRSNLTAELINTGTQLCLFVAVLLTLGAK